MISASVVPGEVFQVVVRAVLRVYNEAELTQLLRFKLDMNLDVDVGDGSLSERVYSLVDALDRQGRLDELLAAMVEDRPESPMIAGAQEALRSARRAAAQGLSADGPPLQPPPLVQEGEWQTADPLAVVAWAQAMAAAVRAVDLVETGEIAGTACLVAPRLLAVGGPIVSALRQWPDRAADVDVTFDLDSSSVRGLGPGGDAGDGHPGERYQLDQHAIVALHPSVDAGVLLLGARESGGRSGPADPASDAMAKALSAMSGTRPEHLQPGGRVSSGAPLSLLSHAWRRPLQLQAGLSLGQDGDLLRYTLADGDRPNAEGAPVLDKGLRVVAIHLGQEQADGSTVGHGLPIAALTALPAVSLALALSRAPLSATLAMAAR